MGIKIHLHCFEYGRGEQPELNKYCEEVIYYPRENLAGIPLRLPYIVSSRINQHLLKNLLKDNYPVLIEGIHCTYFLYHGELNNKKVVVQLHNVEYQYYRQLANATNNLYKKIYYTLESRLLKKYENLLARKAKFVAINGKDKETYQRVFLAKDVECLPAFLPFNEVKSQTGKGNFCLYHGNLSVPENEKAAMWLLQNVFNQLKNPFIIAGKNPSQELKNEVAKNKNVEMIENPSEQKMEELIKNAQIHLLPSFNCTGIKIKLLNALFNGRFVISNSASLEGTKLETLCEIAETSSEYIKKIRELLEASFTERDINRRKEILGKMYDNRKNAEQLMKWL
jgi:glycosyltransferase involved in cell wall biosynthesis